MFPRFFRRALPLTGLLALAISVCAQDAEKKVESGPDNSTVEGDVRHFKKPESVLIESGGQTTPEVFDEEVYGTDFTVKFPGLPKGKYTVNIDLAEVFHRTSHARVMDISINGVLAFGDVDIAAEAGFGTPFRETTQVDFSGEGDFTIAFHATRNLAKFNGIQIVDASGKVVRQVSASDFRL